MIFPTATTPAAWTSDHAKQLKTFLATDAGQLALQWVAHFCPPLLDGDHINKTLVASGAVKGYQDALSQLIALTYEQPKDEVASDNYPSLDDDSAWGDLTKSNPGK